MEWAAFVLLLVFGGYGLQILNNYIRAKHGYPLEGDDGKKVRRLAAADDKRVDLLAAENERLKGSLLRLEERVAVLERIATDPAVRVAKEIDALRG